MVISLTVPAKSFACSIAMSRFTRVSQTIMLPNAATIISQIAPARRSQIGSVGKSDHVGSRGPGRWVSQGQAASLLSYDRARPA